MITSSRTDVVTFVTITPTSHTFSGLQCRDEMRDRVITSLVILFFLPVIFLSWFLEPLCAWIIKYLNRNKSRPVLDPRPSPLSHGQWLKWKDCDVVMWAESSNSIFKCHLVKLMLLNQNSAVNKTCWKKGKNRDCCCCLGRQWGATTCLNQTPTHHPTPPATTPLDTQTHTLGSAPLPGWPCGLISKIHIALPTLCTYTPCH